MALTQVYTGAHGSISLAAAGTPDEAVDFEEISLAYGPFTAIGRVEDVQLCVQTELQEFYQVGNRDPQVLLPGNVHISGKIGRAYVNGAMLYLLLGRGAKTGEKATTIQPGFVLNLVLQNPATPKSHLKVDVFGVKFENWALSVPQSTFVMEQLTFKAIRMGVKDTDEGTDLEVAFSEP